MSGGEAGAGRPDASVTGAGRAGDRAVRPGAACVWAVHLALLGLLALGPWLLSPYQAGNLARIMILAVFAMGYNLAYGYTGLLSLGHALFLAAGMYAAGLSAVLWGTGAASGLVLGMAAGAVLALLTGLFALRASGVAFMIVTLMFAQAGQLVILYLRDLTGGDQGFVVPATSRVLAGHALSQPGPRYWVAFGLCTLSLVVTLALVRSRHGRLMRAIRENEPRCRLLGYRTGRARLAVLVLSGAFAGVAGAAQALLFGYVGASYAGLAYSILPLLHVLAGGAGTVAGPLIGAALIFTLADLASDASEAPGLVIGGALLVLVLFAPRGLLGLVRARLWRGLP